MVRTQREMSLVIGLVIFCLFVSTSESKDFCEAFEDNGYRIDYSFEFIYNRKLSNNSEAMFSLHIGYDYWSMDWILDLQSMRLGSNESDVSLIFGNHYTSVFSVKVSQTKYEYAFLRKNEPIIEWKDLNNTWEFNSIQNSVLKTTAIQFGDFKPDLSFRIELTSEDLDKLVFVGQKQKSEITRFERTYVSMVFKNGSNENASIIKNNDISLHSSVVDYSEGDNLVIGVFGPIIYNNVSSHLVFFQRNSIIEYCIQNTSNPFNYSLDRPCLTERKVLIECKTQKESEFKIWYLIAIISIVVFILLVIILCVLYWTDFKNMRNRLFCKRSDPEERTIPESSYKIVSEETTEQSLRPTVRTTESEQQKSRETPKTSILSKTSENKN